MRVYMCIRVSERGRVRERKREKQRETGNRARIKLVSTWSLLYLREPLTDGQAPAGESWLHSDATQHSSVLLLRAEGKQQEVETNWEAQACTHECVAKPNVLVAKSQ